MTPAFNLDGLDQFQREAALFDKGAALCVAGPGSGKTRLLTHRVARLIHEGHPIRSILAITFANNAAEEMRVRVGKLIGMEPDDLKATISTFHSLGYRLILRNRNQLPFKLSYAPIDLAATSRILRMTAGNREQLGTKLHVKILRSYISLKKREDIDCDQALAQDPNDVYALAYSLFEAEKQKLGILDFDDMIFLAWRLLRDKRVVLLAEQARCEYLMIDEFHDTDQCQPPGTMVTKVIGNKGRKILTEDVPIESLQDGDRVVAWNRQCAMLAKVTKPISVSVRHYEGDLLEIQCGKKKTRVTPDHRFYVSMNGYGDKLRVIYLMYRRGFGFRIGECAMRWEVRRGKSRTSLGGLGTRFSQERADKGWILRLENSKEKAMTWEQILSCNYGIPCATYGDRIYYGQGRKRKATSSREIFRNTNGRGHECLRDHGLSFEHPLFTREEGESGRKKVSKRYFETQAINIVPKITNIPSTEKCRQLRIDSIRKIPYSGPVYSLNVPRFHTYVADGLVVKNCQMGIAKAIAAPQDNFLAVCDSNQAIYSWRGADYRICLDFGKYFPEHQKFFLATNYRSLPHIVSLYKETITGCPSLIAGFLEKIFPFRKHPEPTEGMPEFVEFATDNAEAEWVTDSIAKWRAKGECDFAVLYRTNRQACLLEEALFRKEIPYIVLGACSFFNRAEVKDLLAFLRILDNRDDNSALERIVKSQAECSKYLGAAFLRELAKAGDHWFENLRTFHSHKRFQVDKARGLYDFIEQLDIWTKNQSVNGQLQIIAEESGLMESLMDNEQYEESADNDAAENIPQVIRVAGQFKSRQDFLSYVSRVSAASERRYDSKESPVQLMTVHRAKGKEFGIVYFVGVNDDIIPHKKSQGDPDAVEEEQRIAYVGISRAKDHLYVTCFDQPSRFLSQRFAAGQKIGRVNYTEEQKLLVAARAENDPCD